MTTLYFTHTLTNAERENIEKGTGSVSLRHTMDAVQINRTIAEAETHLLIDNLKDRGVTSLTEDELEELNEAIEGGNMLADLATGLLGAIKQGNSDLTLKLMEAIILGATGEQIELKSREIEVA